MQAVLKSAATAGGSLALGLFGTVVGFFMMLFLLFFLLRDGRAILDHLTAADSARGGAPRAAARLPGAGDARGGIRLDRDRAHPGHLRRGGLRARRPALAGRLRRAGDDRGLAARRGRRRAGAGSALSGDRAATGAPRSSWPSGRACSRWWRTWRVRFSPAHRAHVSTLGGVRGRRGRRIGLRRAGAGHRAGIAQFRRRAGQVHDRGTGRRHYRKMRPSWISMPSSTR